MPKIAIVAQGRLIRNGSAGPTVMCGLTQAFLDAGAQVTYIGVVPEHYGGTGDIPYVPDGSREQLRLGECVFRERTGNRIQMCLHYVDRSYLHEVITPHGFETEQFDGVVSMESLPLAISRSLNAKKHFTIIGDPFGERVRYLIGRQPPLKLKLLFRLIGWYEPRHFRATIPEDTAIGMFGSRHAAKWSKLLKRPVADLRPFIPVTLRDRRRRKRQYAEGTVVAFGGTLKTTASYWAYDALVDEVIPALDAVFGEAYTLNLVGESDERYAGLANSNKRIRVKGRVPDFEDELSRADIFVLPMKYPVGVRTRICSALQAGCFCISDPSVIPNMPELAELDFVRIASGRHEYEATFKAYLEVEERDNYSKRAMDFFDKNYKYSISSKTVLDFLI